MMRHGFLQKPGFGLKLAEEKAGFVRVETLQPWGAVEEEGVDSHIPCGQQPKQGNTRHQRAEKHQSTGGLFHLDPDGLQGFLMFVPHG